MLEYKIIIQIMKITFKHQNQCFNSENCYWNSFFNYKIKKIESKIFYFIFKTLLEFY